MIEGATSSTSKAKCFSVEGKVAKGSVKKMSNFEHGLQNFGQEEVPLHAAGLKGTNHSFKRVFLNRLCPLWFQRCEF